MCAVITPAVRSNRSPEKERQLARMFRAARDTGVQEFCSILAETRRLRDRVLAWLRANDNGVETTTTRKLAIATTSTEFEGDNERWLIVRQLTFLDIALEGFVVQVEGGLHQGVLPEAFEEEPTPTAGRVVAAARTWLEWCDSDGDGSTVPLEHENRLLANMRAAVAAAKTEGW